MGTGMGLLAHGRRLYRMGTMRADEFHYNRDTHQLILDGHVHMIVVGNRKK